MITYTSCNTKRGIVETGPRLVYEPKPVISKAWSVAIGLLVFVLITLAVVALFS